MLYLSNPSSPDIVASMLMGRIGFIDQPRQLNSTVGEQLRSAGVPWAADNGCYANRWNADHWWAFLERHADQAASCLFAVAPDVVADQEATYRRARPWLRKIRRLGYPVAYVAQDGTAPHRLPWDLFQVVFIGGTTSWKLGPEARALAHDAHLRGKTVHVGRVNSDKRWRYVAAPWPYGMGAESCDGTFLTFGPRRRLPELLGWVRHNDQPGLF